MKAMKSDGNRLIDFICGENLDLEAGFILGQGDRMVVILIFF